MAQMQQQQMLKKNLEDQEEQILKERFFKHCEKDSGDGSSKNSSFERQLHGGQDNSSSEEEKHRSGLFEMNFGATKVEPSQGLLDVEGMKDNKSSTKNSSRQYSSNSNNNSGAKVDELNLSKSNSGPLSTPGKDVEASPFTEKVLPEVTKVSQDSEQNCPLSYDSSA